MNIGIIGTGRIGSILAELWAGSGHQIMVSSKHPEKLDSLLKKCEPACRRGSVEEAAKFGETVVLSIPLGQLEQVIQKCGEFLENKVIIDTMNPVEERDGASAVEITRRNIASGVATQEKLPKSKVVRAFCSICHFDLESMSHRAAYAISVPFSSDNESAQKIAIQLINDAGFNPYFLGPLHQSKQMDPGGIIFGKALTQTQIKDLILYHEARSKK